MKPRTSTGWCAKGPLHQLLRHLAGLRGSRASLFTGKYPHTPGVHATSSLGSRPGSDRWRDAWYHCVNIGKMHINPYDAKGGFHQRFVVENKDRPLFLEERDAGVLRRMGQGAACPQAGQTDALYRYARDPEGFQAGARRFPVGTRRRHASRTSSWAIPRSGGLKDRRNTDPLFLQIGFPGPHPPYDPVPHYLDRYADADIPAPLMSEGEQRTSAARTA